MPAEPASSGVPPNWTSTTERRPDALVVRLSGELDYPGRDTLESMLDAELDANPPALVLDLADVLFCDSSSLQVLLRISTRTRDEGIGFALAATRAAVTRPIQMLALTELLPTYRSVDAALDAVVAAR